VSRSIVLAFLIALLLHVLLAGVELDVFKEPFKARNAPEVLTVDLITPAEAKKSSKVEKQPEKPVIKNAIAKKPTPKPKTKPTVTRKKEEVQRQKPLPKRQAPTEIKAPAYLPSPDIFRHAEEKTRSEMEHAFVPDMVEKPAALPQREDSPRNGEGDRSASLSPDEPVAFKKPKIKSNNPPNYPLSARRRNYEGTVLLDVLVRRDGTVGSIRLARSSGHEALDRAAVRGVKKWAFYPGKRGDEPVEMWVAIPIRFQLR